MSLIELTAVYVPIWAAVACYVDALRLDLLGRQGEYESLARRRWLIGAMLAVIHVVAAFLLVHHGRLEHAYETTGARTAAALAAWGFNANAEAASDGRIGVWMNFLFVAVWLVDAGFRSGAPQAWRARPRWLAAAVHAYLAFIVFNATAVFGSPAMRVAAWLALVVLLVAWRRGVQRLASSNAPLPGS
ncbi:MAG TPA: hypothetical protein VGE52_15545 [Pirellulales bacterium]